MYCKKTESKQKKAMRRRRAYDTGFMLCLEHDASCAYGGALALLFERSGTADDFVHADLLHALVEAADWATVFRLRATCLGLRGIVDRTARGACVAARIRKWWSDPLVVARREKADHVVAACIAPHAGLWEALGDVLCAKWIVRCVDVSDADASEAGSLGGKRHKKSDTFVHLWVEMYRAQIVRSELEKACVAPCVRRAVEHAFVHSSCITRRGGRGASSMEERDARVRKWVATCLVRKGEGVF